MMDGDGNPIYATKTKRAQDIITGAVITALISVIAYMGPWNDLLDKKVAKEIAISEERAHRDHAVMEMRVDHYDQETTETKKMVEGAIAQMGENAKKIQKIEVNVTAINGKVDNIAEKIDDLRDKI